MNAVEIEEAISALAEQPFDQAGFPFAFLNAFGNKKATIDKLKKGNANKSDIERGVLQRNNIHIAVCSRGEVTQTLNKLRESPATAKHKAKFLLVTNGYEFEAEDLNTGDTIACDYADFPNKFAFFLPMVGITAIKQIKENSFDIRATSRLNRLYVELLKDNKDWATGDRRSDMNHFMARLIFCFFAEDTDIFRGENLFTETVNKMSESNSSNTHEVISELFRSMGTPIKERSAVGVRSWADAFPYVNGGLFSGSTDVPTFSRIARSYLLHIGTLDWRQINPDIFGSMIQAVADDEERGALGMHYTSVPNILKVLNPLFLDDLRQKIEEAGDNARTLLNLRKRIARIRVFDPACGSGNFLVIAYKQMRELENEINERRGENGRKTDIPITNFRGIELRDFSAEVARLALIIAEYQCNVLHRGQKEALDEFLPLDTENWITCGNALRLDWLSICPPTGTGVKIYGDDLLNTPLDQTQIDFKNEGGETYICGNPPYLGSKWQTQKHKDDLAAIFEGRIKSWKSLDYVSGWLGKAAEFAKFTECTTAFVSTNSICQGLQVPILWPSILSSGQSIVFAHTSFKWSNLASHNAGVTVVIVGVGKPAGSKPRLYSVDKNKKTNMRIVKNINAYLVPGDNIYVGALSKLKDKRAPMQFGNHFYYATDLLMSKAEAEELISKDQRAKKFIRNFFGSKEVVSGLPRACLWINDDQADEAIRINALSKRFEKVEAARRKVTRDNAAQTLAAKPYRFRDQTVAKAHLLAMPAISSENRPYMPVDLLDGKNIIGHKSYALYDAPLWNLSVIASRLHWVWISTVCNRMRTDFSYSNTLGWNTFPIPTLTEKNKSDLEQCASEILLARETNFPKAIADLYQPDEMPSNLLAAHDHNDEVTERIYIGRRFKNDTERLEKLFEFYTKMTTGDDLATSKKRAS